MLRITGIPCSSSLNSNWSRVKALVQSWSCAPRTLSRQIDCKKCAYPMLTGFQQMRCSSDDCDPMKQCEDKPPAVGCGPSSLSKNPCGVTKTKKPKEKSKEVKKPKFQSMWHIEDCERIDDCDLPPRYDIKYYRISDKLKRKYQVTWDECPRMLIKPKKVCLRDSIVPRPLCRRVRKEVSKASPCLTVNPMECKKKAVAKCPRFTMPCCKPARNPPSCSRARSKSKCVKRNAPYPSFSECQKDALLGLPPTECRCLDSVSLCEAWAHLRRRLARGQGLTFKCGKL
ncbi:uncharacterized protein [Drosophila tropicalis]|uniref:uncharacterized protein n=1 Tax=Drosophila tropicalis TaxID=46794 RepID=UPI0035ABF520